MLFVFLRVMQPKQTKTTPKRRQSGIYAILHSDFYSLFRLYTLFSFSIGLKSWSKKQNMTAMRVSVLRRRAWASGCFPSGSIRPQLILMWPQALTRFKFSSRTKKVQPCGFPAFLLFILASWKRPKLQKTSADFLLLEFEIWIWHNNTQENKFGSNGWWINNRWTNNQQADVSQRCWFPLTRHAATTSIFCNFHNEISFFYAW